jgi:hypothetical protein
MEEELAVFRFFDFERTCHRSPLASFPATPPGLISSGRIVTALGEDQASVLLRNWAI